MIAQWLKNRLRSPSPVLDEVDDTLRQVYLQLFDLQRTHTLIDVAVQGSEARYQSIILSVNPETRQLVIDELFPTDFVGLPGQPLHITIRQNAGRRITFETRILTRQTTDGVPYYTLAMPETLEGDQRRSSYRLSVGSSQTVDALFVGPDQLEHLGRVLDVSAEGVRIEIPLVNDELMPGQQLSDVRFDFDGIMVDCDLEVSNVLPIGTARQRLEIGGKFVSLSRDTQRQLEKSIMQIQRDRARMSGVSRVA